MGKSRCLDGKRSGCDEDGDDICAHFGGNTKKNEHRDLLRGWKIPPNKHLLKSSPDFDLLLP